METLERIKIQKGNKRITSAASILQFIKHHIALLISDELVAVWFTNKIRSNIDSSVIKKKLLFNACFEFIGLK